MLTPPHPARRLQRFPLPRTLVPPTPPPSLRDARDLDEADEQAAAVRGAGLMETGEAAAGPCARAARLRASAGLLVTLAPHPLPPVLCPQEFGPEDGGGRSRSEGDLSVRLLHGSGGSGGGSDAGGAPGRATPGRRLLAPAGAATAPATRRPVRQLTLAALAASQYLPPAFIPREAEIEALAEEVERVQARLKAHNDAADAGLDVAAGAAAAAAAVDAAVAAAGDGFGAAVGAGDLV
jgi:hypothetical protein